MCQYSNAVPPDSTRTISSAFAVRTTVTVPDSTGYTGVPSRAEISMPSWNVQAHALRKRPRGRGRPCEQCARVAERAAHRVLAVEGLDRPAVGQAGAGPKRGGENDDRKRDEQMLDLCGGSHAGTVEDRPNGSVTGR